MICRRSSVYTDGGLPGDEKEDTLGSSQNTEESSLQNSKSSTISDQSEVLLECRVSALLFMFKFLSPADKQILVAILSYKSKVRYCIRISSCNSSILFILDFH